MSGRRLCENFVVAGQEALSFAESNWAMLILFMPNVVQKREMDKGVVSLARPKMSLYRVHSLVVFDIVDGMGSPSCSKS